MKFICKVLLLLFLSIASSQVFAAAGTAGTGKPVDVVTAIYRNFGWELTEDIGSRTVLIDQPRSVLQQYFTPKLVKLIVSDRKYVARTKEVGHLDFILLSGSQDPGGIGNIRITAKPGTNIVSVLYDQDKEKDVMKIDYHCIQTGHGWRVADIRYKSRKSATFPVPEPEQSLLDLLSQPY
ncbi:MAG TPA: hypothetical protein VMJ66_06120 [Geobacteraceae bacterium]|nr:hypothetical protein [Geobacteraceae bacterium]